MKRYLLRTLFLSWFLLLGALAAQAQSDNLTAVRAALRNGSSRELSQYLAPTVELGFGDKQSYSATQAELIMKDFFAKTAPSSFEYIHQGSSGEGGIQYAIGRYTGRGGAYRVFIKLKPSRGTPLIDTLEFTKE